MAQPTPLEKRLRVWERMIANHNVRASNDDDGLQRLKIIPGGRGPAERAARNDVREWWLQKYIVAHHKRLGFTGVQGPYETGPDFRVRHRGKWHLAEAEIDWKNYLQHGHTKNPAFAGVQFLLLLSESRPPARRAAMLPPVIKAVDRAHFSDWYVKECAEYARTHQPGSKLTARVNLIAGAMQEHWVSICPDAGRQMATCPDCNLCPYFGDGTGEAGATFRRMATDFAFAHCVRHDPTPGNQIDLAKVREADLRRYVEAHGPF